MAIISQNAIKSGFFGPFERNQRNSGISRPGNQVAGDQESRESGRIVRITRYSDNHCLVTRYPDAHYDLQNKAKLLRSRNIGTERQRHIGTKLLQNTLNLCASVPLWLFLANPGRKSNRMTLFFVLWANFLC
jgi:hypothetical protein